MQFKLATLTALALATLAAATPAPRGESPSDCSTTPIQCCDSVVPATDPSAVKELGLLGIVLSNVDVLVGLTCTPITVIGTSGGSW